MSNIIKIVAADDHQIFLQGLESLLGLSSNYRLCGVAGNGDSLLRLIKEYEPDIVLVDLSMPGTPTSEIIEYVNANNPSSKLIALTMHMEAYKAKSLIALGLSGYILKESAFEELTEAIDRVLEDDIYLSNAMLTILAEHEEKYHVEGELTQREREVLENAAKGQSNKEIARSMNIGERTVRFHLSNCCLKLKANGRSNAIAIALKESFINF